MADDGLRISTKTEKTLAELLALGGVKIPTLKKDTDYYQMPVEDVSPKMFDAVCSTGTELEAAIASGSAQTIMWKGTSELTDFSATAGTNKLIFCQRPMLGKNSVLVVPAGIIVSIYGGLDCSAPGTETTDFSWEISATETSSVKCLWLLNSGNSGKVVCSDGMLLYERKQSGLTLMTSESAEISQSYWHNTNASSSGGLSAVSHDATLTGAGTIESVLGLANPAHYVAGATDYGGTIATDLDGLTHTGFYTCLGTAAGAPNTSYSWFVLHTNSNAGTLYALQTAIAYNSGAIICYERVKAAGTWGSWILRSSSGMKYDNSMDCLAAKDNVSLYAGTDTQWSAHAALWKPKSDMALVVGTSTLNFILPQPVSGKNYIVAAYKYETSGTHTLLCATGINSMPSGASIQSIPITRKISDFVGGQSTYFVIFTNANGASCCGVTGSRLNITPYLAAYKANMGVLTEAPSTLTFDGEETARLFVSVTI